MADHRSECLDVLCVGDIASDVFIELSREHVDVVGEGENRRFILPLGAKVPFERFVTIEAGGDAANVAVALSRLGLRVGLASYLGADQVGFDMLDALRAEHVDTDLVEVAVHAPTNQHFVLWLDGERTILVHHEAYDYRWPELRPEQVPTWLYLTSISEHGDAYEAAITDWLEVNPAVRLAFEPGTMQIERGAEHLARLYRRAELVVCNREEAATITGLAPGGDVGPLLAALRQLGPRHVVITDAHDGADGADDQGAYHVPIYPDVAPLVDRTGAGDAFAATLVAFLARGRDFTEALYRAPVNAMSVVHELGPQAGLLSEAALEALLVEPPAGYAVTTLEGAEADVRR